MIIQNEEAIEDEETKVLRDFRIQTNKHLPHNTSDLNTVDMKMSG